MTAMTTASAWDVLEGVNLPDGYRVEITDGRIIMTPQGENQWEVILSASTQIKKQLSGKGRILSAVMIDFPSTLFGYAPDMAVIAPGAERNSRRRFEWHDVEAVLEVVSPSGETDDYVKKVKAYAECGIPVHVVIDPAEGFSTVYSAPSRTGAYREAERVPFGNDLFLPLGERTLVLETGDFPVEPPTPGAAAG
ncbi:Putative restriction endonuclease [Streptomyces sp. TLI_053]|uniref:Uma2 family endonuclease n=1 Tax=Streptomyces sp. TLI_053 TaxID=1855352 RepID=UPI00087AD395|nr:Uma2 family endonuclease [Streptomyces sp. TLI_053]SDT78242.1 Putative restriction endonuclease [Streptomyces sp. TLI_053]